MRLAKMLQAKARTPRDTEPVSVPETFLGFCEWLGVELTPGQAEFARVAYDGLPPLDVELAQRIFGPNIVVGRRRVVAAVCGRRAGKTYVMVALRMVHGMLTRFVPKLPPGIRAVSMIIAPRNNMRAEAFRYALGAVQSKPELRAMLVSSKAEEFTICRPDGKLVTFETGVATAGGTAARGRWFLDFALDECAFFRDSSFKVNDEELYRAGSAVLLPGGQILVTSTPWAEGGLLYRFWKERPDNAIVAHAPTLVMNDNHITREAVAEAEADDPDNAAREFGARFMTSGTTVFFESVTLDAMCTKTPFKFGPGDIPGAGGDFAFRGDSSALLMVALRNEVTGLDDEGAEIRQNVLHIFDGTEERPAEGAALKPSTTVARFVEVIAGRCRYVTADQHHRSSIEEHLQQHGLIYAPSPNSPVDNYVRARQLLREGVVRLHVNNLPKLLVDRLLQQLRETKGKPTAGGSMSIVHPRWATGGHGDLADAFTLAIWQVCGTPMAAPPPEPGTKEHAAALLEKRQQRLRDKINNPADRGRGAWWRKTG